MEDADKPLDEAAVGKHTARTESDICELILRYFKNIKDDELDESRYRNAGEIIVLEHEFTVEVKVPLPYFHHLDVTPEQIEDKLKRHFPPAIQMEVGMAEPPEQYDGEIR